MNVCYSTRVFRILILKPNIPLIHNIT
jgi:hypothetical protein